MGYSQTVSETFYSPDYPVDEENEELDYLWDDILLFSPLLWIKFMTAAKKLGHKGRRVLAKITEFWGMET